MLLLSTIDVNTQHLLFRTSDAVELRDGAATCGHDAMAGAFRGIHLFVQPPRSPKLHGTVEQANRTRNGEFDGITEVEPEFAAVQTWETVYHTIRPHQVLGYRNPSEYVASVDGGATEVPAECSLWRAGGQRVNLSGAGRTGRQTEASEIAP